MTTKSLICLSALLMSVSLSGNSKAGDTIQDPESWYRDAYGALWADRPGEQIDAILSHYSDSVTSHNADGSIDFDEKYTWLVPPMKEWLAEGWLGADLAALETTRINANTASFKALWVDSYSNAPEEQSCGWYLADHVNGRWLISHYADLDCARHGLSVP